MATETQKKDNLLQLTTMSLLSLTAGVWDTLGETSFALGNNIGTQLLEMMEKDTGLEIAGETPQDVMTEIGRIFVDEFGLAQDIDVAVENGHFELKVRTYAVDRLNVISSDGRSEKSRQSQLANTGFRDFSSLTCPTAGAGRSSK